MLLIDKSSFEAIALKQRLDAATFCLSQTARREALYRGVLWKNVELKLISSQHKNRTKCVCLDGDKRVMDYTLHKYVAENNYKWRRPHNL